METEMKDLLKQLDSLLAASNQSWLLGAGISLGAGIPLMWPLTERILTRAVEDGEENDSKIIGHIQNGLTENSHIEHILSQLSDHRAIAERRRDQNTKFGNVSFSVKEIDNLHQRILAWIAETVRWGYKPAIREVSPEVVGTHAERIVDVKYHSRFVSWFSVNVTDG